MCLIVLVSCLEGLSSISVALWCCKSTHLFVHVYLCWLCNDVSCSAFHRLHCALDPQMGNHSPGKHCFTMVLILFSCLAGRRLLRMWWCLSAWSSPCPSSRPASSSSSSRSASVKPSTCSSWAASTPPSTGWPTSPGTWYTRSPSALEDGWELKIAAEIANYNL